MKAYGEGTKRLIHVNECPSGNIKGHLDDGFFRYSTEWGSDSFLDFSRLQAGGTDLDAPD
jgi:hypothetical protein